MAKIGDNILGAGQGSIGNVVVYTMHGKSFIRSKPSKYNDRKSEAQLAQRARMQTVTRFLTPFKELIRKTYAAEAVGRAPYHAAKSQIMRNALEGNYPDFRINKAAALLSKGPLPLPDDVSVKVQEGNLLIEWSDSKENEKLHGRDTLVVIAYDQHSENCEYLFTSVGRKEKSFLWNIRMELSQDELPDVWIAFRSNDEIVMSDSLYVTP